MCGRVSVSKVCMDKLCCMQYACMYACMYVCMYVWMDGCMGAYICILSHQQIEYSKNTGQQIE